MTNKQFEAKENLKNEIGKAIESSWLFNFGISKWGSIILYTIFVAALTVGVMMEIYKY